MQLSFPSVLPHFCHSGPSSSLLLRDFSDYTLGEMGPTSQYFLVSFTGLSKSNKNMKMK